MIFIRSGGARAQLIRLPWWAIALATIAGVAIVTLVVIFAASLALVLVPLAIIAGLIARFRGLRAPGRSDPAARQNDRRHVVIETTYEDVTDRR